MSARTPQRPHHRLHRCLPPSARIGGRQVLARLCPRPPRLPSRLLRCPRLLSSFAKTDLLVLDDFGLAKLNSDHRRDLLELLEDRYASRSTLVTSQLPLAQWHELLGDPTLADAILDRLVHNACKLELKGGSMRKLNSALTHAEHCTA